MTVRKTTVNRTPTMWLAILWFCLSAVSANTESRVFDLPSMTMLLSVKTENTDQIIFQDRLTTALQDHLNGFYLEKLMSNDYGSMVTIDRVGLSSQYEWAEISEDPSSLDPLQHYEVHGYYDCQLKLTLESQEFAGPHLTQSQMEIFFIEAFQQGNYWTLVHKFLSDEVLQGINDVKVTVLSDGFVPIGRADPTAEDYNQGSLWTAAIKTGIFFAGFFCLTLVCLWIYMVYYMRRQSNNEEKESASVASLTDQDSADHDYVGKDIDLNEDHGNADDDASTGSWSTGSWMDSWAKNMTSIPLRETGRKRSPRARRHRPQQQLPSINPGLDCIREGADEDASVSSFKSRASRVSRTISEETNEEEASLASYDCIKMSLNPASWLANIQEESSDPFFPDVLSDTVKANGRLPRKAPAGVATRNQDPDGKASF
jgi:hypothetical protein